MKNRWLLPLAVIVFIGLAVVGLWSLSRPPASAKRAPTLPERLKSKNAEQTTTLIGSQRFDWRQIESRDYMLYVKNLRAIGCPEQTIRDIIVADLDALFDSKKSNIVLTNRVQFWKTGTDLVASVKEQLIKQHNQLESERNALLKKLLGDDVTIPDRPATIADLEVKAAFLEFVPAEQRTKAVAAIQELDHTFATEFGPLLDSGQFDANSRERYKNFCNEKEQQLVEALGNEGQENYELRASFLAGFLRHRFIGIDLSEGEFRQLFRFAKQFQFDLDDFYVDYNNSDATEAHNAAALAVWDKAREIVGDQRFARTTGAPTSVSSRYGFK